MDFLKKAAISFFTAPIAAVVGALVLEARYHTFITFNQMLLFFGVFAVAAIAVGKAAKLPISIFMAVAVGVLMAPYFQLFVGQIDVFAVDPPEFRESVSVPEIRIQLGELKLTNDKGEEVVVLERTPVHTLYPGGNIVPLGTLDIPAGNYEGGKMSVEGVEVDVEVDIEKELELNYAKIASQIPSDAPADEIRSAMREGIVEWFLSGKLRDFIPQELRYTEETEALFIEAPEENTTQDEEPEITTEYEKITTEIPITMDITDMREEGGKIKFTFRISVGEQEIPMKFPYPAGRGGPDIVLDFELNELGFPVDIQPIVKLPPGMPDFRVPAKLPTMPSEIVPPSDFDIPQDQLEAMAQAIAAGEMEREEAIARAEAMAAEGR